MPPSPELGDIAGEIWESEVLHQIEAKKSGCADCDIGISGEVTVDLYGKQEGSYSKCYTVLKVISQVNSVHGDGDIIGDDHFFEHPPQHLTEPIRSLHSAKRPFMVKLREQ